MAIEIVDLPINSMVTLSSLLCKRLPEGKPPFSYGFPMVFLWFSYGYTTIIPVFEYCEQNQNGDLIAVVSMPISVW